MGILIGLLLWILGEHECCKAEEVKYHEFECERRHRELMEMQERQHKELLRTQQKKSKITRNIAKDEYGRVIAQEIIEEA